MSDWFLTNFQRGTKGNMLPFGCRELKIKIAGSKWVAGRLDMKKNGQWKVIQIEQTGTKNNPWKDKVVFEMLKIQDGKVVPMPPGDYRVTLRAERGSGVTGVTDEFYIV